MESTIIEDIKFVFENREDKTKKRWDDLKEDFIDRSLRQLLQEECPPYSFQLLYNDIAGISDHDLFDKLTKEF